MLQEGYSTQALLLQRLVRAASVLRCQELVLNMIISNTNTHKFMRKCFGKHYQQRTLIVLQVNSSILVQQML